MEQNLQLFAELINIQEKYLKAFNQEWKAFLDSFSINVAQAQQLHIGNQMRPQLVLWGSLLNKKKYSDIDYKAVSKVAVSVEAVHKASVLIDDIIDGDTKRRGVSCVHHEYGEYQTLLFAICLLARGISQINSYGSNLQQGASLRMIGILCDTIQSMCLGAIEEVSSSVHQQIDMKYIQNLIDCETAQLIKNSLYMGYILSDESSEQLSNVLCTIGTKCGYIFQVMNDLEPFCNPEYIKEYKGKANLDFIKSRKSIVMPYLYRYCSKKEREIIFSSIENRGAYNRILDLFHKYDIRARIMEELEYTYKSIIASLEDIEKQHKEWAIAFKTFIKKMYENYSSILYS